MTGLDLSFLDFIGTVEYCAIFIYVKGKSVADLQQQNRNFMKSIFFFKPKVLRTFSIHEKKDLMCVCDWLNS